MLCFVVNAEHKSSIGLFSALSAGKLLAPESQLSIPLLVRPTEGMLAQLYFT